MPEAGTRRSFADTVFARLLALAVAIGIGALLYVNWADDFRNLFAGNTPPLPITSGSTPVGSENPALAACLERRVGDVDGMLEEGIISDAQHESFRMRATELCLAQNPG